jgi:hypothetical protein
MSADPVPTSLHRPGTPPFRRATGFGADVVMLLAVILFIPFAILAIGIPVALVLQLLVWIGGSL